MCFQHFVLIMSCLWMPIFIISFISLISAQCVCVSLPVQCAVIMTRRCHPAQTNYTRERIIRLFIAYIWIICVFLIMTWNMYIFTVTSCGPDWFVIYQDSLSQMTLYFKVPVKWKLRSCLLPYSDDLRVKNVGVACVFPLRCD